MIFPYKVRFSRFAAILLLMVAFLTAVVGFSLTFQAPRAKAAVQSNVVQARQPGNPARTNMVISQIYGGSTSGVYKHDFIELFNPTTQPITMNGWSVQYTGVASTTWNNITVITGTVGPGKYFLIAQSPNASGMQDLPTPDASGSIIIAVSGGKVALVNTSTPLPGCGDKATDTCTDEPTVVDFVGYGPATDYEGAGPAPAGTNNATVARDLGGCEDTDDNAADFMAVQISSETGRPRNSATAANACPVTPTPASTSTLVPSQTAGATSPTATATGTTGEPTACTIQFNDVPPGSTFYTYVRCIACRGVISGYPCGATDEPCPGSYFRPGLNVTRGQISKMVALAAELSDQAGARKFEDVPSDSPFYLWIQQLANTGAIGGYPCGGTNPSTGQAEPCNAPSNLAYFRPNNNTTRGQLSKIVSEAADFTEDAGAQQFADVPPDAPFFVWVQRLSNREVVSGYPCGGTNPATGATEPCDAQSRKYFRVNNNVTRGQTAKIVAETFFPNCVTPARP